MKTSRFLLWRGKVQLLSTLLVNSYFLQGARGFCAPVLNCWSCPGAIASCPLGALQYTAGEARFALAGGAGLMTVIPAYALGTLFIFAVLLGRFMCGWLCPFGWLQDLLARLRRVHLRLPLWTGYCRYAILVGLIFVVPFFTGEPWFSKLCPQGALQGGLLQPLVDPSLRPAMQSWWWVKQALLLGWLLAFVLLRRPFCRVACPLGAIFALFNRVSALQVSFDRRRCTDCEWCVRHCPAGIDPRTQVGGHLCVSCLQCARCRFGAIAAHPIWREPAAPGEPGQAGNLQ